MTYTTLRPKRLSYHFGLALASILLLFIIPACAASGPATAIEVCDSYDELATELGKATGFFDNGVFNRAKSLGRVAVRYETDPSVMANGELLKEIGDSDSTSDAALDRASASISALCGQRSLSGYSARLRFGLD